MPPRTHYDLLGLPPTADPDEIKKAFRREIARYHPDKVAHLGKEFQEMAAVRAAELTAAYKTLTDADARAQYDATAGLPGAGAAAPPVRDEQTGDPAGPGPGVPPEQGREAPGVPSGRMFERERAGRDDIVRRAVMLRLRETLERQFGAYDEPQVRGFELACIPKAKPSLFSRALPPRVLARMAGRVDGPAAAEAWMLAARSRVAVARGSALVVLLFGPELARPLEILQALDSLYQRRLPGTPEPLFVVPVNFTDWSAQIPPGAPESVGRLLTALRTYV